MSTRRDKTSGVPMGNRQVKGHCCPKPPRKQGEDFLVRPSVMLSSRQSVQRKQGSKRQWESE